MSLANILQPNDYDLFCNSITTVVPIVPTTFAPATTLYYMNTLVQSIPNNVATVVLFDATSNTSNFASPPVTYSTSTGVFTCIKNCTICCSYQARFLPGGNNGDRRIYILQSNVPGQSGLSIRDALTTFFDFVSGSWSSALKIGDTFTVNVLQSAGGSQDLANFTVDPLTFTKMGVAFVYQDL